MVPAAIWLGLAWQEAGAAWTRDVLLGQTFERHLAGPQQDRSGPLYYLAKFWGAFGPWSVLVPLACWDATRRRRGSRDTLGVALTATWFLGSVLLFSFAEARRDRYLLPILPSCALILGHWVDRLLEEGRDARAVHRLALTLVCVVILVTSGLVALGPLMLPAQLANLVSEERALQALGHVAEQHPWPMILGGLLLACATAGLIGVWRRRQGFAFAAAVTCLAVASSTWGLTLAPVADRLRGDARLLEVLSPLVNEDRDLVILGRYGHRESTAGFFHFLTGKAPRTFLKADGEFLSVMSHEPVILLVRDKFLRQHPEVDLTPWWQLTPAPLGHHKLRIFANPDVTSKRKPRD
jgi:hypothetical protein